MTAAIPDGMTDPDDIDRWLEARDLDPVDLDEVVTRRRPNPDITVDPAEVAAIAARVSYGRLPFWRRWHTPTPPGWRIRHPTGPVQ